MTRARWLLERGVFAVVIALVIYVALAPAHIVGNDNAEFSTLATTGGIAHPSGYPGYVLWLRAWSWLPASTPAHAAALATVILAIVQLAVLHAAARAWGAKPLGATMAVVIYAAAPLVMRYSTEAEAFAPNLFVTSVVMWLSARRGPLTGLRRVAALGLVAGLGMTAHLTCVLVAPIGILGVVRGLRESKRWPVGVALVVVAWLVGMTPYLYFFIAPSNALSWPNPESLAGMLSIITREQYGGAVGFSGEGGAVPFFGHLAELARTIARSSWGLGVLGLVAIGVRIARPDPEGETRIAWCMLALSLLLAGPLLATQFDVDVVEFGLHIVHRFHLLPVQILVIPTAIALTFLGRLIERRAPRLAGSRLAPILVHLVFVLAVVVSLPDVTRFHTRAMEAMVENTLLGVEHGGVILGNVDELDVGIRYLQLARGQRPDVLFFRWRDAAVPWYREKFASDGLTSVAPYSGPAAVKYFLDKGRPVYATWSDTELTSAYPNYPVGTLVRLLPPAHQPPSLQTILESQQALFLRYDLAYDLPGRADEFATWVHRKYVGAWARLADQLAKMGDDNGARTALEFARAMNPHR